MKTNMYFICVCLLALVTGLSSCRARTRRANNLNSSPPRTVRSERSSIDLKLLDGNWRITALYKGNYEHFSKMERGAIRKTANLYRNACADKKDDLFIFNVARTTYRRSHCGIVSNAKKWTVSKGRTGITLTTPPNESIRVVKLTADKLILEGEFVFAAPRLQTGVYLLERTSK